MCFAPLCTQLSFRETVEKQLRGRGEKVGRQMYILFHTQANSPPCACRISSWLHVITVYILDMPAGPRQTEKRGKHASDAADMPFVCMSAMQASTGLGGAVEMALARNRSTAVRHQQQAQQQQLSSSSSPVSELSTQRTSSQREAMGQAVGACRRGLSGSRI